MSFRITKPREPTKPSCAEQTGRQPHFSSHQKSELKATGITGLRAHEERDDRFVAAFDLGRDEDRLLDRDRAGALGVGSFRVAYVVRAVTPGRFVQPGTVVQDIYRPDVMARTAARRTEVAPR